MQSPEWTIPADNLESVDTTLQALNQARSEGRMTELERRPFSIETLAANAAKREISMRVYLHIMRHVHGLTAHTACELMIESGEVKS